MKKLIDAVTVVALVGALAVVMVYHLEISRWIDQNISPAAKTAALRCGLVILGLAILIPIWMAIRFSGPSRASRRLAANQRRTMNT